MIDLLLLILVTLRSGELRLPNQLLTGSNGRILR